MEQLGAENIKITKVAAHQDVSNTNSAFECWAFQHNIVADRAARMSNLQRDNSFWALRRQHCSETQWVQQLSRSVQQVILAISKQVVAREVVVQQDETQQDTGDERSLPIMVAHAPAWSGFVPDVPLPTSVTSRFGYRFVATLVAWFQAATTSFTSNCETSWISIHQLYLDYQHQTGELGLVNQKGWKDPEILPGLKLVPRTFKKRSSWFGLALRAVFRAFDAELPWMVTRPRSTMIALHTSCVALPWPTWRLEVLERWLMARLPSKKAVTRDGKDLAFLPPAKHLLRSRMRDGRV